MSRRAVLCVGMAWMILSIVGPGCQRAESSPHVPTANTPAESASLPAPANLVAATEVQPASEPQATIERAQPGPAARAAEKPPLPEPATLSIADKIARRCQLQQRGDDLFAAARSQLTAEEQELAKQIAFHRQVFDQLGQDIANDHVNLAQRGLVMPWEMSARRNLLTHGRAALERSVSQGSLGVAARIGNEQLRGVKEQIDSLERQQYRSIASRIWRQLSPDEQAAYQEYLPDFAGEASGRNAAEETRLSKAIRSEPQNANLLNERARLRIARGALRQAADDLSACFAAAPDNGEARLLYGELMLEFGNDNTALSQFTAVAALKTPIAAEGWARRGLMAFYDNEIGYAQENADRAFQVDPNCAAAHYLQARINARRNLRTAIVESMGKAAQYDPKNSAYHFEHGEFLAIVKRFDDAIAAFTRVAELEPYWWRPYWHRCNARIQQQDFPGALDDLNLAAQLAPDEPLVFQIRAIVHGVLGHAAEAEADKQRTASLTSSQ